MVLAGLGGQGVIKASDILADAALRAGLDVKKAEVHGMSQRGGSVTSDVRFGEKVLSPMVPAGEADFLVVLAAVRGGGDSRPAAAGRRAALARPDTEAELPNKRSLNVALLGALSVHLDLPEAAILAAMKAALPERLHAVNERAFELGRMKAAGESAISPTEH